MASDNPNLFKRLYENVMGTPEQNAKAEKDIAAYKAAKEKEKMKAEEEKKKKQTTNMAKGGAVAKKKASAVPAKGKVVKSGSKAGKTGKTPLLVIAVKPKMAKGGAVASKKKGKC
jgi:hypothetical protein